MRVAFESQVRRISASDVLTNTVAGTAALPGELLVEGGTKHVWVNESWQPARLNKVLPDLYELLKST
ncbi:hypothetical protein D3C78_1789310 [compost metagenome]